MCGIFFSCSTCESDLKHSGIKDLLHRRGPDKQSSYSDSVLFSNKLRDDDTSEHRLHVSLHSTVLSLRGASPVSQPLIDETSNFALCWNGEAWRWKGQAVQGNDSRLVFAALMEVIHSGVPGKQMCSSQARQRSAMAVQTVLRDVDGPFAFLFYDAISKVVFYGRDPLGRRSMLLQVEDDSFTISSVVNGRSNGPWKEVGANGIYEIELARLADRNATTSSGPTSKAVSSISLENLVNHTHLYPWDSIKAAYPTINRAHSSTMQSSTSIVECSDIEGDSLLHRLSDSLRIRLHDLPGPQLKGAPKLAILFSGGIDCTLIARLCHDLLPYAEDIDLLNVAFENPRIAVSTKDHEDDTVDSPKDVFARCPDRATGIASYEELKRNCPQRRWNFVAINIPFAELQCHRAQVISLMYPHDTEMDLSISLALYFAARGKGDRVGSNDGLQYTSTSKILLSGLGADELFGGYTRHESAYSRGGEEALVNELDLDFKRIGERNLGRDDRIISHWGKEVRYPYLDEHVVTWALERPSWEKYGFLWDTVKMPSTVASLQNINKLALRLLAWNLGMRRAADEKKRAIQFGARTAKMQHGRTKGTSTVQS